MDPHKKSETASVIALTIAGFDPSGGAGVLADAATFGSFGFSASAVITSITFQNPGRCFGAVNQSAEEVRKQLMPLLEDFVFACAKTGMLPTREIVSEVASWFRKRKLPGPVVDPVMVSSSGQRLMEDSALETLIHELLPLARLVTPNIPEAEALTGISITSEATMRQAAARIRELGASAVLIKGGHLLEQMADGNQKTTASGVEGSESRSRNEAIDLLDNNGVITVFRAPRIAGKGIHGSGCILSAAIAAGLGKGHTIEEAVGAAKLFVAEAIRNAPKLR